MKVKEEIDVKENEMNWRRGAEFLMTNFDGLRTQKPFFKFIENWLSLRKKETERDRSRIIDIARRTLNLINKSCWRNIVEDEATVLHPLVKCTFASRIDHSIILLSRMYNYAFTYNIKNTDVLII